MQSRPELLAKELLLKILKRADKAVASGTVVKLTFPAHTAPLGPACSRLKTRTEQETFFATLTLAERAGAIQLNWNNSVALDLQSILVLDFDRLALHLRVERYSTSVEKARLVLKEIADNQRVVELLAAWAKMAPTGRLKPEHAGDVRDAWRVIEAASKLDDDIPQRRLSCRLFDDSKRIEQLSAGIRWLTNGRDGADIDEIFAKLGVIRFPQPLLIAGPGTVTTVGGQHLSPRPYVGLHPASVKSINSPGRYLLTVENQTTFNEFAMGHGGQLEGTVVFVNGQPGTRLVDALKRLYVSDVPLFHWGDQDAGGFYILERLNRLAKDVGKFVTPWRMDEPAARGRKELSTSEIDRINRICHEHGWDNCVLQEGAFAIEQEGLALTQPLT